MICVNNVFGQNWVYPTLMALKRNKTGKGRYFSRFRIGAALLECVFLLMSPCRVKSINWG
jgi:hypothetical protein